MGSPPSLVSPGHPPPIFIVLEQTNIRQLVPEISTTQTLESNFEGKAPTTMIHDCCWRKVILELSLF